MRSSHPDRVVSALAALASFAYVAMWAGALLILTALPALKLVGGADSGFHPDLTLVPAALVVIALAEVFRRGAALEHEQSLVI
jgi:hypothetical protein